MVEKKKIKTKKNPGEELPDRLQAQKNALIKLLKKLMHKNNENIQDESD